MNMSTSDRIKPNRDGSANISYSAYTAAHAPSRMNEILTGLRPSNDAR